MSSTIPDISLDSDWRCDYFEDIPTLHDFMPTSPVPSLTQWRFDRTRDENWRAWLEKRFDLPMRDVCVNYVLRIDHVPEGTRLYVNGRAFGEIAAPMSADVTDYVTLEENVIALRVPSGTEGAFSDIRLVAVPCK